MYDKIYDLIFTEGIEGTCTVSTMPERRKLLKIITKEGDVIMIGFTGTQPTRDNIESICLIKEEVINE